MIRRHFLVRCIGSLLFAVITLQAFAPATPKLHSDESLFPVSKAGRAGYIGKSGKLVIAPQFDLAFDFSEGLAIVSIGDRFGFIDRSGRIVISPKYSDARNFSEGLAPVMAD